MPQRKGGRLKLTAPTPSEDELHASVVKTLRLLLLPSVMWTAMPMGWHKLSPEQAAKLYRLGAARGWPDLLFLHDGKILGIELKSENGRLSKSHWTKSARGARIWREGQEDVFPRLIDAGMKIIVCNSVSAVLEALSNWNIPLRGRVSA